MLTCAVIDFETTGLGPPGDRIIEVGAVLVQDGAVVGTFEELMDPGFRLPSFITGLTGITNAMLRGKPQPEAVMPRLRAFLGGHACVAHNASFDGRFFAAEMERAGEAHERSFICSMLLSRRLLPYEPSHRLGHLAELFDIAVPDGMQAHRALADALVTAKLWCRLMRDLQDRLHGLTADAALIAALCRTPKAMVPAFLARHAADATTPPA